MAIINGIDQESVKSFSGAQGTLKLPSREVVILSRPTAFAFLYDPADGSLMINGSAAKFGAGLIYPVYNKRPEKVKPAAVTEFRLSSKLGSPIVFYGVTNSFTTGASSDPKGFKSSRSLIESLR